MDGKQQELIARVLDLFAQKFDKRAILRGGMVLRILGSPRFTNDLDYLFVPYESKKDIVSGVVKACGVDRNPYFVCNFPNTAFSNILDSEFLSDLLRRYTFALVGKSRAAGNYKQVVKL